MKSLVDCELARAPSVSAGYVMAALFVCSEFVDTRIADSIALAGLTYWYYCIYRIHLGLAKMTAGTYPISPGKVVGFQLIPIFSVYWVFHWPAQIAALVNSRAGVARMRKRRAALMIFLGFLLMGFDGGIGLAVLFSALDLIEHRLDSVFPGFLPHVIDPVPNERWHALRVAVVAGLGAGIGYVIYQGTLDCTNWTRSQWFEFFLVAGLMVLVIEPALEHLRKVFTENEPPSINHRAANSALAVGALAFTGLLGDFLHHVLLEHPEEMLGALCAVLVMTGTVTYSWTCGARHVPPKAAVIGALTGSILGLFPALPLHDSSQVLANMVVWGLLGLVGGLAIDHRWTPHAGRSIVPAITAVIILEGVVCSVIGVLAPQVWFGDLSRVAGWSIALLLYPPADAYLAPRASVSSVTREISNAKALSINV